MGLAARGLTECENSHVVAVDGLTYHAFEMVIVDSLSTKCINVDAVEGKYLTANRLLYLVGVDDFPMLISVELLRCA